MVKKTEKPTVEAIENTEELTLDTVDDFPDKPVPIEKLLKWRKQGLSYDEIGSMIGRSKQAVHQRLQPYKDAIENLPAFKENRADIFAIHQQRLLNSLSDDDIRKIPPGSRFTGVGILYDKERLERGQSTGNISMESLVEHRQTLEEASQAAQERKDKAMAAIAALKAQDSTQTPELSSTTGEK
jgi:hypothetical protein